MQEFPRFLRADYDEHELDDSPSMFLAVAPDGKILWANRAWHGAAATHGLVSPTSYFDGISADLRPFFVETFSRAIDDQTMVELDYECPTPEEHRTYRLYAAPIQRQALLLEHSLVAAGPADAKEELESSYTAENGMITQCGNCRRVREPATDAWHFIPEWVQHRHPRLSHGICPSCAGFYWRSRPDV